VKLRRLAVLGCLVLALAGVAGCGLPVDALPQPILLTRCRPRCWRQPRPSPPPTNHGSRIPVAVYFVAPDGTQLVKTTQWVIPKITPQKLLRRS